MALEPSLTLEVADELGYSSKYGAYVQGLSKLRITVHITEGDGWVTNCTVC